MTDAALAEAVATLPAGPLAVALSGGGDSLALTALLCAAGREIATVTVDHRQRAESGAEAAAAAQAAEALGARATVLTWDGWDRSGNLQAAARAARRRLIADWAEGQGIGDIALGHTREDQAETLLLRLARGSGLYGLAAMAPRVEALGVTWHRPLLSVGRAALRNYLADRGLAWAEDPSNDDLRFDRVRMRQAQPTLDALGLTVDRLAETAGHLARAAGAVRAAVADLAAKAAEPDAAGYVQIALGPWRAAPAELRLRLLAEALRWVAGAPYTPRLAPLTDLAAWAASGAGGARTLHGCLVEGREGALWILREPARTGPAVPSGDVWDGRWATEPLSGATVNALGEVGLAACPDWRATGHPRAALLSSPAFWRGQTLIAAPLAMPGGPGRAKLVNPLDRFLRGFGPR